MASILKVSNFPSINVKDTTLLDADQVVTASPVSLLVRNSSDMAVNDPVFIGTLATETCEVQFITAITDATHITVAGLRFPHSQNDPITAVYGDKIQLYRAPNVDGTVPADGLFAQVGSPVAISTDTLSTNITDSAGSSSYWYKKTYINSVTTQETSQLDGLAQRGGGFGAYVSISDVRDECGMQDNIYITDEQFAKRIRAAQDHINSYLRGCYTVPFSPFVPEQITEVTRLLAAGRILESEYGVQAKMSTKGGEDKMKEAEDTLTDIREGYITLLDQSGQSLRLNTAFSSYPDNSTSLANPIQDQSQDGIHMASVDDIY